MKNNTCFDNIYSFVFVTICILMLVVSGVLIMEYLFLQEQAQRLVLLQDEYHTYIQAYREWWEATYGNEGLKDHFNVVNRDMTYLRDCAISFGQKNNIPAVLGLAHNWYVCPWEYAPTLAQQQPKAKKRSLRNRRTGGPTGQYHGISLRWPIEQSQFWISSPFGPRKKKDGSWAFHYGIDMAALKGTVVHACAPGVVIETSYALHGYGKSIVLKHDTQYRTRYAHLNTILVQRGQKILAGDPIGRVGDTGSVRGINASHLHLEVLDPFGKRINPRYILR